MKKLILLLTILTGLALADTPTITITAKNCDKDTPCFTIKEMATTLNKSVGKNISNAQSIAIVQNGIVTQFDFDVITRLAMGSNWKSATPEQQAKINIMFKQMLVNTYTSMLSKFKGASIIISDSNIIGDKQNKAVVLSTSTTYKDNKANTINIEYDLAKIGSTWKVYDVKLENISVITTYRSQFNDIIQKEGIDGLINLLQTKVDALKTNG